MAFLFYLEKILKWIASLWKKHQILFVISIIVPVAALWLLLPQNLFSDPFSTVLVDNNGELLGAAVASDQQWRFPPVDTVSDKFAKAIVCFEDKRFFYHPGIDPLAIARALRLNITHKNVVSGASTISMQTIRLSRKKKSRTFLEKCVEMLYALRLDIIYSKQCILSLYASYAPFGGNVIGLETASWRYFGIPSDKLTWAESATLAVLPNSPSLVHPGRNRTALLDKRNHLLSILYNKGCFDSATLLLSLKEPLPEAPYPIPMYAPHLLAKINQNASAKLPGKSKAAFIKTTLDSDLQKRFSAVVNYHHDRLSSNGVFNAGLLAIDIRKNEVLAYVGNVTNPASKENHAYAVDVITAPRSTGSILKPFLYMAMLESGELVPTQLVPDIPVRYGSFAPQNYRKTFDGAVEASAALARSLNVPAVNMLYSYTTERFYSVLKTCGMTTLHRPAQDYGLTLILGGAEGSLWDITSMYAGIARTVNMYAEPDKISNQYHFVKPSLIVNRKSDQKILKQNNNPFNVAAAWLTLDAMVEVARPEEDGNWEYFTSSKRIAWKTGTSFGYRDAWAIGVTPEYVIGVWVGNADGEGRPGLTGTAAAAPVLFDAFGILEKTSWFTTPEADLPEITVCAKSGFLAGPDCTTTKKQRVTFAGKTSPVCPYCKTVHFDKSGLYQVNSSCEPVKNISSVSCFILPPSMEYYYRKKHFEYQPLPPFKNSCNDLTESVTSPIAIIYPKNYSRIYIPLELSGKRSNVVFEAAHRSSKQILYWHIDNEYIGKTESIHQMSLTAAPGRHILTLVDSDGARTENVFFIIDKNNQ